MTATTTTTATWATATSAARAGREVPGPRVPSAAQVDRIDSNRSRTRRVLVTVALLAALPVFVVVVLLGAVLGAAAVGVVAGLVLAIAAGAAAWAYAAGDPTPWLLAELGARPAAEPREARLLNLVDGLCLSAGVPPPAVVVAADDRPNALVLGPEPRRATLVVTEGLLAELSRMELEAIVAHELARIRALDTLPAGVAVRLRRVPVVGEALARPLVDEAIGPLADLDSVGLTKYPPALAAALDKVRAHEPPGPVEAVDLWTASAVHPYLDERIQALREL